MPDTLDLLERIPLFQGLDRRQLRRIAGRLVERDYQEGESIVKQGGGGEGFFIIVSGAAQAQRERADGTMVTLNTLGPMEFFGELALLTDTTRTASVVATEPTRCLALTRWDFMGVLKDDAEMAVAVLQELAARFCHVLGTM